jgi:hypothetical protein
MKIIKIKSKTLLIAILLLIALTVVSFLGAVVAGDDGGSNFIATPLQYIFFALDFPAVFVMGPSLIMQHPGLGIVGLAIDIGIYAFLIERFRSWVVNKRVAKVNSNYGD